MEGKGKLEIKSEEGHPLVTLEFTNHVAGITGDGPINISLDKAMQRIQEYLREETYGGFQRTLISKEYERD